MLNKSAPSIIDGLWDCLLWRLWELALEITNHWLQFLLLFFKSFGFPFLIHLENFNFFLLLPYELLYFFFCVSSTAIMSFWKFVFASFLFALYDKIFSCSTWMYSSERLKLESNVDDDLFSLIISNSGSWDTSCCVHVLFLAHVSFCIIIEIIIVHVTELYYDGSHPAEYIWILNRLLTDASRALFLIPGSFFMVLASSENSAVDAFFLLFLPLQNKYMLISIAYHLIITNM